MQVSASQTDDEGPQRQAEKPSAPQPPSRGRRPRGAAAAQVFRTAHEEEQPFLPSEDLPFTGAAHSHLALQLFLMISFTMDQARCQPSLYPACIVHMASPQASPFIIMGCNLIACCFDGSLCVQRACRCKAPGQMTAGLGAMPIQALATCTARTPQAAPTAPRRR